MPLLLTSEESLADLNARLAEPLPMNRFRPNLVVAGWGRPFAEDEIRHLRIGEVRVELTKHCDRCDVTRVNQETAERGREPLFTLATFRNRGQKLLFGVNGVPREVGRLRVGDQVEVLDPVPA